MQNKSLFSRKEAERNAYYSIACPYLTEANNCTRLGVSATNKKELEDEFAAYNIAYPIALNPDTRTTTAIANKNKADENLQVTLRSIFADIPQSALTVQDRSTLNLPEHNTHHTPVPMPASVPVATIASGNRLEHSIAVCDEHTPNSHAKPYGVRGCQIWEKVGSPAINASELTYVATISKAKFINHFNGADAGKVVYYWARWENTRGETGPWSAVVAATIAG